MHTLRVAAPVMVTFGLLAFWPCLPLVVAAAAVVVVVVVVVVDHHLPYRTGGVGHRRMAAARVADQVLS